MIIVIASAALAAAQPSVAPPSGSPLPQREMHGQMAGSSDRKDCCHDCCKDMAADRGRREPDHRDHRGQ